MMSLSAYVKLQSFFTVSLWMSCQLSLVLLQADGPVPTRSHPEVSSHPDESPPIDMIHQLAEDIQMLDEDAMEGGHGLHLEQQSYL